MTEKRRGWMYAAVPLLGLAFVLWYISAATCGAAYSDYIRQILSYLPDVWNPEKFFVPDILTRIPINFPVRAFNVSVLGFSVTFDLVMGCLGLGLAGLAVGAYCRRRSVGMGWFVLLMFLFFSLNKWEMLTNGTGWVHFLAFACFYYHYLVLDRVEAGEGKERDELRLRLLPFAVTLCVAGPYCAVYSGVLLLAYGFLAAVNHRKTGRWDGRYGWRVLCVLIPLLLYMVSNSMAVYVHTGAYTGSIWPILREQPMLFVKFFIKSFGGMVMEKETLEFGVNMGYFPYALVYLMGAAVMAAYLIALWLNFRFRLYERTIFPLILITAGGMNHVLILLSRWIFLRDDYGMSARYALQFQVGILGILLTCALLWGQIRSRLVKVLALLWCAMMVAGNGFTDYREILTAPGRKAWGETVTEMAGHLEDFTDEELVYQFQYGDADKIRQAMKILEDNHLNMYR